MDDTQQGCLWEARVAVRALTLERSCPGLNSGSVMSFPYPFSPRGVVIIPLYRGGILRRRRGTHGHNKNKITI
jgi:hypothetical protein